MCYEGTIGESSKHRKLHLLNSPSTQPSSRIWQDQEFKAAFDLMDRDCDGTIKSSDLMHFLQHSVKTAPGEDDVDSMIALADQDNSGAVDFAEFLSLVRPKMSPRSPSLGDQALNEIFRVLDRNGDGVLCEEDLSGVMESLGQALSEEDVRSMMVMATGSERQDVTFQDFCKLMSSPGAQ